jgi:hypothetical protein
LVARVEVERERDAAGIARRAAAVPQHPSAARLQQLKSETFNVNLA